jgi:antiviral helicase SKI2
MTSTSTKTKASKHHEPAFNTGFLQTFTMADSLISALQKAQLSSDSIDSKADDWIDSVLEEQRPRKRIKQDREALKLHLEQKYLTPSASFSTEWLNKLQQYCPLPASASIV